MLRLNLRKKLLVTVSAFAISVSLAQAQEAGQMEGRFWMEFNGMLPFWQGGKDQFFYTSDEMLKIFPGINKISSVEPFYKVKKGYMFSGEIGYHFADSPWYGVVRFGHGFSKKKSGKSLFIGTSSTTISFPTPATLYHKGTLNTSLRKKEKITFFDFDVGRDVGVGGNLDMSILIGVRFTSFKATERGKGKAEDIIATSPHFSTSAIITATATTGPIHIKRKFFGVGPKLGFNVALPLSDTLSWKMGVAGALLIGKRKVSGFDGDEAFRRSKSTVVPNIDATVGLAWKPTENMQFTIGYGVNAFFNMVDSGFAEKGAKKDRIIHGPKIGLRIMF